MVTNKRDDDIWLKSDIDLSSNTPKETDKAIFVDDPMLSMFKDVNDSIETKKLIEHEGHNDYFYFTEMKSIFDNKAYAEDFRKDETINRQKYIVKVPSRVNVANEHEFGIVFKLAKGSSYSSENTIIKLISTSYYFSESIFQGYRRREGSQTFKKDTVFSTIL